jgi:hypothetical protein
MLWLVTLGSLFIICGMIWLAINIDANTPLVMIGVGALIIILTLFLQPAFAHDHDRPGLNDWYTGLRSGRGPCCDGPGKDAKHLESDDWESKDGHYRVRLDGQWIDVPDDAVLKEPNKDGRTLVWPVKYFDGSIQIRCFIPGSMT